MSSKSKQIQQIQQKQPKQIEQMLKKLSAELEEAKTKRNTIMKRIKALPVYKEYINAKKALEISPQYQDVKRLFALYDETQESNDRRENNALIKKLTNKLYDLEDGISVVPEGNESD